MTSFSLSAKMTWKSQLVLHVYNFYIPGPQLAHLYSWNSGPKGLQGSYKVNSHDPEVCVDQNRKCPAK